MSDIVQAPPIAAGREDHQVKLVKMAGFGAGEKSTAAISVATALAIVLLWWLVSALGVVPHLFLPRPDEVLTQIGAIYRDGYAGASLSEHVLQACSASWSQPSLPSRPAFRSDC